MLEKQNGLVIEIALDLFFSRWEKMNSFLEILCHFCERDHKKCPI
ncbi:Hypothetical protein AJF4211_001640 [Avibacterium paragallinarum JF4211]|nr:Hypothetical protein AJF4211_001640 [Avibacterium paragallinarum JF4211]